MNLGTPSEPVQLTKENLTAYIAECATMMDEQNIPTKGRLFWFMGKDGNQYQVDMDHPITDELIEQLLPDALKRALDL